MSAHRLAVLQEVYKGHNRHPYMSSRWDFLLVLVMLAVLPSMLTQAGRWSYFSGALGSWLVQLCTMFEDHKVGAASARW